MFKWFDSNKDKRHTDSTGKEKHIPMNRTERVTPEYIRRLSDSEIFVFGSNLAGHHDGGAILNLNRDWMLKRLKGWKGRVVLQSPGELRRKSIEPPPLHDSTSEGYPIQKSLFLAATWQVIMTAVLPELQRKISARYMVKALDCKGKATPSRPCRAVSRRKSIEPPPLHDSFAVVWLWLDYPVLVQP